MIQSTTTGRLTTRKNLLYKKHKFNFNCQWICRPAGGLFFGLRYQFPVNVLDEDDISWTHRCISIGLIAIVVKLTYKKLVL